MRKNKTSETGSKTSGKSVKFSPLSIHNKDPRFDYSFRRKEDVINGGQDYLGWEPINEGNNSGEISGGPLAHLKTEAGLMHKTKSGKQIVYMDTIACRRPKEVSAVFKAEEDERYNSQVKFVRGVGKNTKTKFRQAMNSEGFVANIEDNSEFKGGGMLKQRAGTTENTRR